MGLVYTRRRLQSVFGYVMTYRFAIHLHLYYRELWPEIAACIRNFKPYDYDLFITTPHADDVLRETVLSEFPSAEYHILENRGYDIGPFCEILNRLNIEEYDFIVKLHTKRDFTGFVNLHHFKSSEWRHRLLHFCSSSVNLERTLNAFATNPKIGMISHGSLITGPGDFLEEDGVRAEACNILSSFGLVPRRKEFVAGSCFIARAELLRPLKGKFSLSSFNLSTDHRASKAHILERLFGYMISSQGFVIRGIPSNFHLRNLIISPLLPIHRLYRKIRANDIKPSFVDGKLKIISVVRDKNIYNRLIFNNANLRNAEKFPFDNTCDNLPIPELYNRFLDSYDYTNETWFAFIHEDFEIREPLEPILSSLSPNCIYGPIGCKRRGAFGIGYQVYLGFINESDRAGSGIIRSHGSRNTPNLTPVETFDCCALIVHSSLIKKHNLRFDPNLEFDLYAEDFSASAKVNFGIESRILRFSATHYSNSVPTERLYRHLPYLAKKYPKNCFCGTCTYFGTQPLLMRMQKQLLNLFERTLK